METQVQPCIFRDKCLAIVLFILLLASYTAATPQSNGSHIVIRKIMATNVQPCHASNSTFLRFLLATVPRTGSTLLREVFELNFGVATEEKYPVGHKFLGPGKEAYARGDATFSNKTLAWAKPCGLRDNCGLCHRSSGNESVIVKTHCPFGSTNQCNEGCISGVLTSVRHPVDNYIAWWMYNKAINQRFRNMSYFKVQWSWQRFLEGWNRHISYWRRFANLHEIPLFQFRFEDLCLYPAPTIDTVAQFLQYQRPSNGMVLPEIHGKCILRNLEDPRSRQLFQGLDVARSLSHHHGMMKLFEYDAPVFLGPIKSFVEQIANQGEAGESAERF